MIIKKKLTKPLPDLKGQIEFLASMRNSIQLGKTVSLRKKDYYKIDAILQTLHGVRLGEGLKS
jgi:hypothetical protein